jgi:hypothetical protein
MAKWSTTHNRILAALTGATLGLLAAGDAVSAGAGAAESGPAYLDEAQVLRALPTGSSIDVRFDADLDGDGLMDLAVVGGTGQDRKLVVWLGIADGHQAPLFATLAIPGLLQQSNLDKDDGTLLVMDATGDEDAAQTRTIYRYRRMPGAASLQLVSLEAERYQGKNAVRLAWNLQTGAHEFARGSLVPSVEDAEVLVPHYPAPRRSQRDTKPLDIAQTPLPDALIDAELRAATGRH